MGTKSKIFRLITNRLTPSGYSDNGLQDISSETVEIPVELLKEAIVTRKPKGVKGVNQLVSRIDLRGKTYLVLGEI